MKRLKELNNYRFVSYHNEIERGKHIVKLRVMAFERVKGLEDKTQIFFMVTEEAGRLSAISLDGSLHITELT